MKTILRAAMLGGLLLVQALSYAESKHSITPKFGEYNLESTTQTIAGSTSTFEKSSSSVGVEYKYKITDNMTIGGSGDYFKHNYNRATIDGTMGTTLVMFNLKYKIPVADWFNPYIGASAGIAAVNMSGSIIGTAIDAATGISIGMAFPINDTFAIGVEYRKINSEITGELTNGNTAVIDASGDVLTANLTITF